MRKRISKLGWWLPVINAIVVGLILWLANDLNWRVVWPNEALIGLFVLAYVIIVLRLPVDEGDSPVTASPATDQDEAAQRAIIASRNTPPVPPKPFLGHRYPAGAGQPRKR